MNMEKKSTAEVLHAAMLKGLQGGTSGAMAMTIQVI